MILGNLKGYTNSFVYNNKMIWVIWRVKLILSYTIIQWFGLFEGLN